MAAWSSGYVADISYTYGFYRELTPALLSFIATLKDRKAPDPASPLTFCELGCGQGFSVNLLAAANPQITFHATDFNPVQIAGAQALAAEAGLTNAHFYDCAFADFAEQPGLPDRFDIIALHGIYSWISSENRAHIVDFIRRKLKLGGLVYISYNTLPGWAAVMPLRRFLVDHAERHTGPIASRVEQALSAADALMQAKAGYFAQNPNLAARFERMKPMSRNYLAHEYFNRDWTPFYFADVVAELDAAKLSFVGSAALLEHLDAIHFSPEQAAIYAAETDPVRREGLRDFLVNQQFRRDVFAKGGLPVSPRISRDTLLDTRFALSTPRDEVPLKVPGTLGEANLQPEVYTPLLDALAKGPVTLRQMLSDPAVAALGWAKLTQGLMVLTGMGHLQPCLPAKDEQKRAQRTRAFNQAVMRRAEDSGDLQFLASPVTGGGLQIDRFEQLFLLGLLQKETDPALFAWRLLEAQGQRIIKNGQTLQTPEDNIAELQTRYTNFEKRVPVLRSLGII